MKAAPSHTHILGGYWGSTVELYLIHGSDALKSVHPWDLHSWSTPEKTLCRAKLGEECVFKSPNPPSAVIMLKPCKGGPRGSEGTADSWLHCSLFWSSGYWSRIESVISYAYTMNYFCLFPEAVTHIHKCKKVKDLRHVFARHCDRDCFKRISLHTVKA